MKCLIFYSEKPNVVEFLPQFYEILKRLNIDYDSHIIPLSLQFDEKEKQQIDKNLKKTDIIISLGGDGSVLSTAKIIYPCEAPILAINFGHLGFIAETAPKATEKVLKKFLTHDIQIEERILLEVTSKSTSEKLIGINEAFIGTNPLHKIGEFQISINGKEIAKYLADGVIVASPTGSTGYSLSAGGTILHPKLDNLIFVPVCPHTLTSRPLVVDGNTVIEVKITNPFTQNLFIDGLLKQELTQEDTIIIKKAPHTFKLIYEKERSYYTTLQEKLNWLI
jgi:NAD+ kinase